VPKIRHPSAPDSGRSFLGTLIREKRMRLQHGSTAGLAENALDNVPRPSDRICLK
jgi:hypothetical protein